MHDPLELGSEGCIACNYRSSLVLFSSAENAGVCEPGVDVREMTYSAGRRLRFRLCFRQKTQGF